MILRPVDKHIFAQLLRPNGPAAEDTVTHAARYVMRIAASSQGPSNYQIYPDRGWRCQV